MGVIDDIIDNLEAETFLNNTGLQYVTALLFFVISVVVLLFLKRIVLQRIKKLILERTEESRVDDLIEDIQNILNTALIFSISLYVAILQMTVSQSLQQILNIIILGFIFYYFLKISYSLVDFFVFSDQVQSRAELRSILDFVRLMIKTTIFILVALWFLGNLGINITALVAGFGVFGLAIAFALQNVITDIFSAIIIFSDKPFHIGDSIKIGGEAGTVENIGIRSTEIRMSAGQILIIPNRDVISSRIQNMKRLKERRVNMTIGVHTSTPVSTLRKIPGMIEKIITAKEDVRFNRTFFTNIGDFSLDFGVVYYITTSDYTTYLERQQAINLDILEAFEKAEIVIPFPTSTILSQ